MSDDLEQQNERLRDALRPFASLVLPDFVPDEATLVLTDLGGGIIDVGRSHQLTAKDIRTAKLLVSPSRPKPGSFTF